MSATQAVGIYGERLAARHLSDAGMQILDQRWRCAQGELDLIALDGDCVVFCEVKTRRSVHAGSALEAVTPLKVAQLRRLALAWLAQQECRFGQVRFDVVAITLPPRGAAVVEHLRAVI